MNIINHNIFKKKKKLLEFIQFKYAHTWSN